VPDKAEVDPEQVVERFWQQAELRAQADLRIAIDRCLQLFGDPRDGLRQLLDDCTVRTLQQQISVSRRDDEPSGPAGRVGTLERRAADAANIIQVTGQVEALDQSAVSADAIADNSQEPALVSRAR